MVRRYCGERESETPSEGVPTLSAVFDHANVMLDFCNVFILSTNVKTDVSIAGMKGLKLGVSKSGHNVESTVVIGLNHASEGSSYSWNLMVQKRFNSTKMKSMRDGDQEGKFIDEHQVDGQDNFLEVFKNAGRHAINLAINRHTPVLWHLAFKGTQIRTENVLGSCNICTTDREVSDKLGVHNLSVAMHSWKHDNILDFPGKDCITIFSFGVFTLLVINHVDVCPIMRLGLHSRDTKGLQSS